MWPKPVQKRKRTSLCWCYHAWKELFSLIWIHCQDSSIVVKLDSLCYGGLEINLNKADKIGLDAQKALEIGLFSDFVWHKQKYYVSKVK